ncbi:MAG: hypothetical protein C4522_02245 [Desulfobacteraceae bacterium]|nr:MAG: hypothetical protein C4522_02245 [Desulfobacteraceae bacterium]
MLKQLIRLINDLKLDMSEYGDFDVVASYFRVFDDSKNEYKKIDIPEDDETFEKSEKIDSPIYEIYKDKDDPEICLITKYLPEDEGSHEKPLNFYSFYNQLIEFPKKYKKYEVVTSAWMHLDDQYTGRRDIPVRAVLVDEELKRICMVEVASD